MDSITITVKTESLKSLQSTIAKFEKVFLQMTEKGANTTLLQKRLQAHYVGLAVLEHAWNSKPLPYSGEELADALNVLAGLFPSLSKSNGKSKTGSPQRTLLSRRIRALELTVQAIEEKLAQ